MPPLAHAADWISSIVFMVPVLGFTVWLVATTLRDRRRERREAEPEPRG